MIESAASAMRHSGRIPLALTALTLAAIGVGGTYYLGAGQEEVRTREDSTDAESSGDPSEWVPPPALEPSPDLGPEEVVTYQMTALRTNGTGVGGIRQCFAFASPLNRAATGPLDRFTKMVRSPPYQVMLQAADVLVGRAVVREDQGTERALVLVTLIDRGQNVRVFRFNLSKQRESPYEGCWMTDAVRDETQSSRSRENPSAPSLGV